MTFNPDLPVTVYLLTNGTTGEQYVGSTTAYKHRFCQHMSRSGCPLIRKAVEKYGRSVFSIQALVICSQQYAEYLEKAAISAFKTLDPLGYNRTPSGKARGFKWSAESRQKVSAQRIGRKHSLETRAKISAAGRRRYQRGRNNDKI